MPNRFVVASVLAAALSGCAAGKIWLPAPKAEAEKSAPVPDKAAEEHQRIVGRFGVIAKTDLSEYVEAVGARVAAASDRPSIAWKFTVLDSPAPRAFSTRGGYVYVNRGMIELLRSESDLAAVLAHEIAHLSTHDTSRAENAGNVVFLGNLAAAVVIQPWSLLLPQVTFIPAGASMAALSRHYEYGADRHGVEYLRRAGYSGESMADMLSLLESLDAYQRDYEKLREGGIFASHPSTKNRYAAVHRSGNPGTVAPDPAFLARLDGLEFGSTKYDKAGERRVLRIREAREGESFATLAKTARGVRNPEAQLRLLNQRYPSGELAVGQLVKVIE